MTNNKDDEEIHDQKKSDNQDNDYEVFPSAIDKTLMHMLDNTGDLTDIGNLPIPRHVAPDSEKNDNQPKSTGYEEKVNKQHRDGSK